MTAAARHLHLIADADAADYALGPEIVIKFQRDLPSGFGWWHPAEQVMFIDAGLSGRDLAVTLLHEIGHVLCADHDDVITDDDHQSLEEWAERCASLLDVARPGRRAVPA